LDNKQRSIFDSQHIAYYYPLQPAVEKNRNRSFLL